jgi:hypothetical protein
LVVSALKNWCWSRVTQWAPTRNGLRQINRKLWNGNLRTRTDAFALKKACCRDMVAMCNKVKNNGSIWNLLLNKIYFYRITLCFDILLITPCFHQSINYV